MKLWKQWGHYYYHTKAVAEVSQHSSLLKSRSSAQTPLMLSEPFMGASTMSLRWLTPLVESKNWDYCVVWRLGDDSSTFMEWVGCCCSGAYGVVVGNVKEEKGVEQDFPPLCRDVHIQHHVRTMACEALAAFPTSIPLYYGTRGEVVTLNEPKWLIHGDASDSMVSDEFNGTQVLIPVDGGLVELYNSRLIPIDQKTIDFISNSFKVYVEEAMIEKAYLSMSNDLFPNECPSSWLAPLRCVGLSVQHSQASKPCSNPSIQGSSTGSTPASTEHLQGDSDSNLVSLSGLFDQSIDLFAESRKLHCNQNPATRKNNDFPLSCINYDVARNAIMTSQRKQRGQYRSKNLVTERNRRNKIKDGLFALRALVPKITKMDRAAIVGDAIDYIKELQQNVKELQDELKEVDAEDGSPRRAEPVTPDHNGKHKASEQTSEKSQSPCSNDNKVHVEVNQIGERVYTLRFLGKHSRGGIWRLMEIVDSLGLSVLNANVTTLNQEVSSIFIAEVKADGAYDSRKLKCALVELTN